MHATGCANGRNTQHTSDTIVGINTFAFKPIQHHIVKAVLENINPNKAQRCDFVLPRAVKACSSSIEKPFCDLLNSIIISCSRVPDTWKCGQITPLHKKSSVFCIAIYHQRIVWSWVLPGRVWYLGFYGSLFLDPCYLTFLWTMSTLLSRSTTSELCERHGNSPGGHFRNFWVRMCRWDPGTLNLYQS